MFTEQRSKLGELRPIQHELDIFDFDAVSYDKSIAACISTSGGKTSSGKAAVGKLLKIRSICGFRGKSPANPRFRR
jgi:hypothetical protein